MSGQQEAHARAQAASLGGLLAQLGMSVALFALGEWIGSVAPTRAAWFTVAGVPAWACVWLTYRLLKLERAKTLEHPGAENPSDDGEAGGTDGAARLARMRARLRTVRSVGFAVTSTITGAYLIGSSIFLLRSHSPEDSVVPLDVPSNPLVGLALTAGLAFVGLVVGRYLVGLSSAREWRLLRAGASHLMGGVLFAFAVAVGYAFAHFDFVAPLHCLATIIPVLGLAVGLEILLSLFLGLYRPRTPGEVSRPAFDSRVLCLLSAPEGIGRAVADTINYQFGFEVSRNWFLQLVARAVWPLVGLSAGSLLLLSCLVVVEPHQQALVTRFGRITGEPLDPGLHLKAPWPLDSAQPYDVGLVRKIHIGSHIPEEPGGEILMVGTPVLWSNIHSMGAEQLMIVAPPQHLATANDRQPHDEQVGGQVARTKGPSVSLIGGDIFVEFRIRSLLDYVKCDVDTAQRFRQVAERETSRELFRFDVDTLISTARQSASELLRDRIQRAADRAQLGIEVMIVGFAGIHPPQEVADAFHETVSAEQERESAIQDARQFAVMQLAQAAGSVEYAHRLATDIEELEQSVNAQAASAEAAARKDHVELLLQGAGGMVAEKIADARAYRWWKENSERGKAERFEKQILTMRAAPRVYCMSYYLGILEQGMAKARKYVLVGDREHLVVRFDFTDSSKQLKALSNAAARNGRP